MRVPDQVLKTAVFLGKDTAKGKQYGGTGYIVAVENCPGYTFTVTHGNKMVTTRYPFMFLATAAHVAEKLEDVDFYIRANKTDGTVVEEKHEPPHQWWYHPTERNSVDAAVMLLSLKEVQQLDIEPIPVTMFVGDETMASYNLGIGDEVFVAGLFKNAKGSSKNIPIIRIGNVAMIPGEKISFPTEERPDQMLHANLLESRSIGGLSGSPVFIRETVRTYAGLRARQGFNIEMAHGNPEELGLEAVEVAGVGRFHFFGSIIGHWHVPIGFSDFSQEAVNMGIAPMVPASKILEILGQSQLLDFMNRIGIDMKEKQV